MTKHYEEIEENKKIKKLVKTTCDICGSEIITTCDHINEVTISHEKGFILGSYGAGERISTTFSPDICDKCFEDKILPVLKSAGVKINYESEDYDYDDYDDDGVYEDPDEE